MIQRIQSIYMFLAAICFAALWFPSMILLRTENPGDAYFSDSVFYANESMLIQIGSGVSALMALISIFLYKERGMQIILAAISSLMHMLFCIGACFWSVFKYQKLAEFIPANGMYFSMAGIVLVWLAVRAIRRDQDLVKSMDRLR